MRLNDFYEHGIARGVVRYAKERDGWQLFGYGWMFRPLRDLTRWRGDGIVARVESVRDARRLAALKRPVVDVAGAVLDAGFVQVNNDDVATGRLAGEHLVGCGFRHFGFCGVRSVGWSRERRDGFAQAIRAVASHIPVFEETLPWWEKPDKFGALRAWVAKLPRPCGLFACNDTAGLKLTALCRRLGLHVPDQVAVIGVDNEDVLCELSAPALSSIPCDCERIGYEAAATLDRILSGAARPAQPLRIPPRGPVVRASSDVLASADPLVSAAARYIREHVHEGTNVHDVLRNVPISRRALEIRFRRELGRTIHDEIVRCRIERARHLLTESDLPIARVAERSGFGTHPRFHCVFRARTGQAPLAYRQAHRSGSTRGAERGPARA